MTEKPTAAVIEVYQLQPDKTDDTMAGSLIVPTEVRINGHPVLTRGGVTIHEIEVPVGKDLIKVTVTLLARRIVVAAKGDME